MSTFADFRQSVAYQGLLLGVAALVTSSALLFANQLTAPAIAERNAEDLAASLSQALPGVPYDNDLSADTVVITPGVGSKTTTVYRARQQGAVQAVAYEVTGLGYSGAIRLIMGVDRDGRILSVRVLAHRETPGLGDKIEIAKSRWIEGFSGLSRDNPPEERWKVKKDGGQFDQFTGATITPRAVVKAVKEGLDLYAAHKDAMLADK
jgi:electron transport complex protein RnfG